MARPLPALSSIVQMMTRFDLPSPSVSCQRRDRSRAATLGGSLPTPLPLFLLTTGGTSMCRRTARYELERYISFINNGSTRRLHPDFGGEASPGSVSIYGFPYVVVDGTQTKRTFSSITRTKATASTTRPIRLSLLSDSDEAITQPHWIEGGEPGNVDRRCDRHLLIVDRDNRHLYELYNVFFDGTQWHAGSARSST